MARISDLKKDFKRLADQNRLAHGYLLFGHESEKDKILFASELANYLENKKWEASNRVLIDAQILDTRNDAGIDLMRSASHFLWQKPAASQKRTLVINRADNLTLAAQNAILKISEEPPAHALIFLIVKSPDVLLPALQSRFQKIFFSGASGVRRQASGEIGKFLKATVAQKKEIIKEIVENKEDLENFVTGLIDELRKDKIKNWKILKELLNRWTLINQFNVNKRLQLEAALLKL